MMTYNGRKFSVADFDDESFVKAITPAIEQYATWRVKGFPQSVAFLKTFGAEYDDFYLVPRINRLEQVVGYHALQQRILNSIPYNELWNLDIARECLTDTIGDPKTCPRTKINACRELATIEQAARAAQ